VPESNIHRADGSHRCRLRRKEQVAPNSVSELIGIVSAILKDLGKQAALQKRNSSPR
jgi:hypothetical protein